MTRDEATNLVEELMDTARDYWLGRSAAAWPYGSKHLAELVQKVIDGLTKETE